ncbi:tryptophan synthase subunit beta [Evansella sp. AB-P1]|uniref:tryptophan synthase subunit beta n=1 Tax=Evansella sp. AB-P1 TaxID=3037653 RepID=UPI00241F55FF|nr:tryptophan synthase subunit beta [Evansella sp. AB-P1]MDG5787590.1 tryptophan synthase subunit beta [Evansella sp. AB-P1]
MKPSLKFCGNRSYDDYYKAVDSGVDYIGFIFAQSKRQVHPNEVKQWIEQYPYKRNQRLVGVFVNESIEKMIEIAHDCKLHVIQCHGIESPKILKELKNEVDCLVFKTIHHHAKGVDLMLQYDDIADGYVVDTKTEDSWGGTGIRFDWDTIPLYSQEATRQCVPCFIAGGVKVENIEGLLNFHPLGIDVSSGIETEEQKDERKMMDMVMKVKNSYQAPDSLGRFGAFGGRYVPETLMYALEELEKAFEAVMNDESYFKELHREWERYSGRPTPLTKAGRVSESIGGAQIYLKREDLNHTGAHKINNAIAQALLAKRMGKDQIIAETGAGQHGVAAATVAARYGLSCKVFMGEEDMKRQELNVFRMRLLGAEVIKVTSGGKTLKDATNEAIRYWVTNVNDTFYLIGSAVGPHPYPKMVREFQSVIGRESKNQFVEETSKLPDEIIACVGGGSNAIGMFYPFIEENVRLTGIEAAGKGTETTEHAATLTKGVKGVLHGSLSYLLQDESGNVIEPYSISAGLDYPGIGPEHAYLRDLGRVTYESITDQEALDALQTLCQLEGILPAIESAHALAFAFKRAKELSTEDTILVCLSGRGDKDVHTIQEVLGGE